MCCHEHKEILVLLILYCIYMSLKFQCFQLNILCFCTIQSFEKKSKNTLKQTNKQTDRWKKEGQEANLKKKMHLHPLKVN